MQRHSIPTCYFPSTALFLDDNRDFLLNFVLQLDEGLAYRIFDNPSTALDYIHNKNYEFEFLQQNCLGEYAKAKTGLMMSRNLTPDMTAIHAEVYNPNRFAEISVIVVDYAMPGMDGLEFCRRIQNRHIKKILLSGQADEKLAIEAFNEGLIDRYIKKNDPDASDLITKNIAELQYQYFQAMSDEVERTLPISAPRCLCDKNFVNEFHDIVRENRIVEYYLVDKSGSFLMLDDDANTSFLLVKNEEDMHACYQMALTHGASQSALEYLKSRKKAPIVLEPTQLNNGDWESGLIPVTKLACEDNYYYAYLQRNDLLNVRQSKILSYHRYLEELDAEELLMT